MKETLQELLVEELRDLYDAEKQLVRALPKMAKAASSTELQQAFQTHLEETKGQVARIEQVFELIGERARSKPCKGMKGLVEEGREVMEEDFEESMLDSAIIGAAQKVEHYEIAGYGTARTLAQALGQKEAAQLLQETLDEEGAADKKLTQIAKALLKEALRSGGARSSMEEEMAGARRRSSSGRSAAQPSSSAQGGGRSSRSHSARTTASSSTAQKSGRAGNSNRGNGGRGSGHGSSTTTDHEEIRRWAEERGGKPACVRGTGGKGDTGMIRIDFPGYSGGESLQPISWDEFFEKFDENNLALVYQEKTSGGQKSNFNKLVKR